MGTPTSTRTQADEQTLVRIARTLPPERVSQLVDFARFLQWQTAQPAGEEAPDASEEEWDQLLAQPEAQRVMVEMAREAQEDYRAGRTTDIVVTKDGRLAPA